MSNHAKAKKSIPELMVCSPELHAFVMDAIDETPADQYSYPIQWALSSPLPERLFIVNRLVVDNEDNTISNLSEHWVLIHQDGSITLVDDTPTTGSKVNGITGRTLEVYNDPGQPMPPTVRRAIKITLGTFVKNGIHYGVTWQRFQRSSKV